MTNARPHQDAADARGEEAQSLLVTYDDGGPTVGLAVAGRVVPLAEAPGAGPQPATMNDLIDAWDRWEAPVAALAAQVRVGPEGFGRPIGDAHLQAPIPRPRRNPFLLAGNYRAHMIAGEKATGIALTERKTAIFFSKPTTAVTGPTDPILINRRLTQQVDWECELVVVIGTAGRDIPAAAAFQHVWGYTVGNDVSARDIQVVKPTVDFMRGKGMDTFFPTGPGVALRDDVGELDALTIRTYVNGVLKQDAVLGQMMRGVAEVIAELSRGITLEPGDMIATGTPSGVAIEEPSPPWLKAGDRVVCEIERIGRLTNVVQDMP